MYIINTNCVVGCGGRDGGGRSEGAIWLGGNYVISFARANGKLKPKKFTSSPEVWHRKAKRG